MSENESKINIFTFQVLLGVIESNVRDNVNQLRQTVYGKYDEYHELVGDPIFQELLACADILEQQAERLERLGERVGKSVRKKGGTPDDVNPNEPAC